MKAIYDAALRAPMCLPVGVSVSKYSGFVRCTGRCTTPEHEATPVQLPRLPEPVMLHKMWCVESMGLGELGLSMGDGAENVRCTVY